MSISFDFGREAENFAVLFLEKEGYQILARNYFFQKAEIDIIALKDNLLVIIEVKARTNNTVLLPEDAVTTKKKKLLIAAAHDYLTKNNLDCEVRFDILALLKLKDDWKINHIKDAFNAFEV